jgi:hypothetical protein
MKTPSLKALHAMYRLPVLLALIIALAGCATGGQRLRRATPVEPPQSQPEQTATLANLPAQPVTQATPAPAKATPAGPNGANPTLAGQSAPNANSDQQAADLMKLIDQLDAANQAGDALGDLP